MARYTAQQRAKAKAEGWHLVTLDITGRPVKRSGATYQGYLFDESEVEKVWEFFNWLCGESGRFKKRRKAT